MAPPQGHSPAVQHTASDLRGKERLFAEGRNGDQEGRTVFNDSDIKTEGITLATEADADSANANEAPMFSAGMIADVQYAPIPDGASYNGAPRYYMYSLEAARTAAAHFNSEPNVPVVIQLGDSVDGKAQDIAGNGGVPLPEGVHVGKACVKDVLDAFSEYTNGGQDRKIVHTYGNHCLYNLERQELQELLGIPFVHEEETNEYVGYYSHVHQNIRFVVIDSYDICKMRYQSGSEIPSDREVMVTSGSKWAKADQILSKYNPNYPEQENSPQGLEGLEKRFVAFNGGVDTPQLLWLRNTLNQARQNNEKVVICSHQPIHPESTNPVCLMWNYDEVLEILREFSDTVIASFCGHAHKGGYLRDSESGIHFRLVEAALEHKPETYALLDFFDDRIVFRGQGLCESAEYDYKHMDGTWTPEPAEEEKSKATAAEG